MGRPPPTEAPSGRVGPARPSPRRAAARWVVLVALLAGAACAGESVVAQVDAGGPAPGPATVEGAWPTTTTTTTTIPGRPGEDGMLIADPLARPWADSYVVADALVPQVALFTEPGVPVPSGKRLDNPSWEGLDLVFLVRGRRGPDWLLAQVMSRPNSAMAWIRAADVRLRRVPHHVVIEREAKRLTVYQGETAVFQTSVATGKSSSPTPTGTFFVDGLVRLSPPHKSYGTGQVSFTGFSEVYTSFGGGVGQVAMHGTQNPALIGTPASNGCVRMRNEDIEKMIELAPTGTPVEVVP